MSYTVRRLVLFTRDDDNVLPRVNRLWQLLAPGAPEVTLKVLSAATRSSRVWVVEHDGEMVAMATGVVNATLQGKTKCTYHQVVDPQHLGNGVEELLKEALEKDLAVIARG